MHHTSCKDAEIQFGRDDSPSEIIVVANAVTGEITVEIQDSELPGPAFRGDLTLGQVIHLRDFLNRHIDHFALAATGSLAERSTDDPTQLAGEELIDLSRVTPYAVGDRQVRGCGRPLAKLFCGDAELCKWCKTQERPPLAHPPLVR